MTAPRITPEEAIAIALATAPEGLVSDKAGAIGATLALMALRLAGYRVVAADGDAAAAGETPPRAQPPHAQPPNNHVPKLRETWPRTCAKCSKIINDRAHAAECVDGNCPF